MADSCATCFYFRNDECHQQIPMAMEGGMPSWPPVKSTDWCGEGLDMNTQAWFQPTAPPFFDYLPTMVQPIAASSATLNIDYALGGYALITLSANVTAFSVSNWNATQVSRLTMEINNTGAFNITFPTDWLAVVGTAPIITSGVGKKDIITLTSADAGVTVYIHNVGQDFLAIP